MSANRETGITWALGSPRAACCRLSHSLGEWEALRAEVSPLNGRMGGSPRRGLSSHTQGGIPTVVHPLSHTGRYTHRCTPGYTHPGRHTYPVVHPGIPTQGGYTTVIHPGIPTQGSYTTCYTPGYTHPGRHMPSYVPGIPQGGVYASLCTGYTSGCGVASLCTRVYLRVCSLPMYPGIPQDG